MSKKSKDQSPISQVDEHFLAFISLSYGKVYDNLKEFYHLNPEELPHDEIKLQFFIEIIQQCKRHSLQYYHYYTIQMLVLSMLSTSLTKDELKSSLLSLISILTREHAGFEYSTQEFEEEQDFGPEYMKYSLKQYEAAPEMYANIELIGKNQDVKKNVVYELFALSQEESIGFASVISYFLSQRSLFQYALSHSQSEIRGFQLVAMPCRLYKDEIPLLSEGFPYREVTKKELIIRNAVIEQASNMWKELKEKVTIK